MAIDIRSVITLAYQQLGILSPSEEVDGDSALLAQTLLNNMLHQLNVDELIPWTREVINVSGLNPQNTYTMGINPITTPPTGDPDIVAVRPAFINRILYYPSLNTMPINVQQDDLPSLLYRRRSLNSIGTPMYFAIDGGYPYQTIYFDIKPQSGSNWTMVYNNPIPDVTIDSQLMAPGEYTNLLSKGLARELAVFNQMPQDTCANAESLWREARNWIKRNNSRSHITLLDDLNGSGNYRTNNIYTGQSGR